MTQPPLRKHSEILRAQLALSGARVADVGCGNGGMVRVMTRAGAKVTGIDCSQGQLARARKESPAGDEGYLFGYGESLPLADGSLDIVVYFNALHHVPVDKQDDALAEAARVLKPGGWLYVVEPLAEGAYFEIMRPVEDETEVRAAAYAALGRAEAGAAFEAADEQFYRAPLRYPSFDDFRDGIVAVDENRRAAVQAQEERLRQAFLASAEQRDGAFHFAPPFRLNLMRRAA